MQLLVTLDTSTAQRAIAALGPKANAAVSRALNRAGGSMKVAMARDVAADTKLKVGVVKTQLVLTKATQKNQLVQLSATGKRIPVEDFNARGPMPSRGRGRGVRADTPAGLYPRAFRARLSTGHVGVFERIPGKFMKRIGPRGGRRQAIRELFGPSLPHVFEKYQESTLARGQEQLTKNLESEMQFVLRQAAASA